MLDAELVDGGLQRNRYSCEMRYPHFSSLSLSSLLSLCLELVFSSVLPTFQAENDFTQNESEI